MFDPKSQNSLLRLRTELNDCCYDPKMKDFISTMIIRIMNYPKKTTEPRHCIKMMSQNKIMMIWYPMSVPFMNRSYNVPIQIYIMKYVPYEPPQIFLEVVQGSAANSSNKDINTKTNQIMTKTLKNWNQYSVIENVLDEIFQSFSKVFPIYKKKTNQQPPIQNQPPVGGGGIYGMMHNEVNNLYQQQNNNNPYNPMAKYGFQPPTKSIYGRSMTLNENRNRPQPNSFGGGIYGNNNNQQPNSFGGGIYGNNNNQQPGSFGGGIYGNNNNNQQPNSFGGGIYGNNNNNQQPNSFGGGIYDNINNNNKNNNAQGGGIYDFNNNNKNKGGSNPYEGTYGAPPPIQPSLNPDEEVKNILLNEVSDKISNKLIEEKKRLNKQNEKMNEYKIKFSKENEKLQNFLDGQSQIKFKCEEDMSNMNNAIKKIQDYNSNNKAMMLDKENCLNYLDIPDSNAIKIIAEEMCMEEMILIVRKGFEKKKISLDETINFMRNSARDLFAIKFLKDKLLNKYKR